MTPWARPCHHQHGLGNASWLALQAIEFLKSHGGWAAAFTREQIPIPIQPIPRLAFAVPQQISPMLLRLTATAAVAATAATAICHLPPAIPSMAWHGMAWRGSAGRPRPRPKICVSARSRYWSGSSRPVFDAARGDGDRSKGGDWPSVALTAHLKVPLLHALHSQGRALNVPKSTNEYSSEGDNHPVENPF